MHAKSLITASACVSWSSLIGLQAASIQDVQEIRVPPFVQEDLRSNLGWGHLALFPFPYPINYSNFGHC